MDWPDFMMMKSRAMLKKILYPVNDALFYGRCINSLRWYHVLRFIILKPGRLKTRIKYKTFPIKPPASKVDPYSIIIDSEGMPHDALVRKTVDTIREHGAAVVQSYFSQDYIDSFISKYNDYLPAVDDSFDGNQSIYGRVLPLDLKTLWFNTFIIDVVKGYNDAVVYARNYPVINTVVPKRKRSSRDMHTEKREDDIFANHWHIDHSTLLQPAIYLTDVKKDGPHMQIISATHKIPATCVGHYSDELIEDSRRNVFQCLGRRGSIQFHDGNVIHRLCDNPGVRTWLKFEFTYGPNILFDPTSMCQLLNSDISVESLSPEERDMLSGLIPRVFAKGYQPHRKGMIPTQFQGI